MFTTDSKFVASRVNQYSATPEKRNTGKTAKAAQFHSRQEAVEPNSALIAPQKQHANTAVARLKKQTIRTVISVLNSAATSTKQSCILVATIWLRWIETASNVANVAHHSRPMFTTLIFQVDTKRLIEKGATTT